MDPWLFASLTGILGAMLAALWSFLMAAKVAAPRAAAKSKILITNILTGKTAEDREILEKIRVNLVRPEVEKLSAEMPEMPEIEIDAERVIEGIWSRMCVEKGVAVRQMQEQLGEFKGPLSELAGSIMNDARQATGPTDIALMRLLNVEVTPKFAKTHPELAMLIESGKVTLAQLVELARQTGFLNREGGGQMEGVQPGSSGFGVR